MSSALLCACGSETTPKSESYDVRTLGSYQAYLVTPPAAATYTYRSQVVATSQNGFTRRHTYSNSTNYSFNMLTVSDGSEYVDALESYAADGTFQYRYTYVPGFLILSADAAVGSSATTVSTVTDTGTRTMTREVVVNGTESVTVPAGTFDALKTTAHITISTGGDSYQVYWWVRGIGRVKIANYQAATPGAITTFELTDHGVAAVP